MAISLYTGPPGSGKSYALVSQVIVEAVKAGRRVLTNIEGVNPEKVWAYCAAEGVDVDQLGSVVLFHGEDAHKERFFPTSADPGADADTFVKGGDLIVFDEWALYWPARGKMPNPELEPFLRIHRHLTGKDARGRTITCDVAIASQIPADVSQSYRGLISKVYRFRKLTTVGAPKYYVVDMFDGHKVDESRKVTDRGDYKAEFFPLYSSHTTDDGKGAAELKVDKRETLWTKGVFVGIGVGFIAFCVSVYFVVDFFTAPADSLGGHPDDQVLTSAPGVAAAAVPAVPPASPFRIVGYIHGDLGTRVVLLSDKGHMRFELPVGFEFDGDRPISGVVDGLTVRAEDRVRVDAPAVMALPMPGAGL